MMNSSAQPEPRVSPLRQAVLREFLVSVDHDGVRQAEDREKIDAGSHRFDIHPGQVVFLRPQGFLVDLAEERQQTIARNKAAIELWKNRYVEVTEDGFVVRDCERPKAKLKLVRDE